MTQDPLTLYKLIVLYMLNKVKFKLTYAQISEFILEKEYTNFLTLQEVISDLQDTELIKADTTMNRTYFSITDEGRNTLSYFGNRIGEAIIADIDAFLDEKHLRRYFQNQSLHSRKTPLHWHHSVPGTSLRKLLQCPLLYNLQH